MTIRDETTGDQKVIREVIAIAFCSAAHSSQREGDLVDALRAAGALAVSLVAEEDGKVVGHIAFSPVTINGVNEGWYGLGPVAVLPALQGRGLGRALIEAGLERIRSLGAGGCVLLGEPEFYQRFGFRADPRLKLSGPPPEYFMALPLATGRAAPEGEVRYHTAFDDV
ncbi:GNAT family N-acetyltransferase [Kaistia sp. MMO-174]|uniref:GNAT family N-acetyltransferase n=1 Tax=Kaistia sp. MMO-174 TaxID=3081256 RepID=UPI001ACC7318|nr:N-acetyltransferase [Hyphomicrobiales bacterium]